MRIAQRRSGGDQAITELFADRVCGLGKIKISRRKAGPPSAVHAELPGRKKQGQILALGHSDTV